MENRFLERLPNKNCPPCHEALQVDGEMMVYRLVKTNPPTVNDFRSASHKQHVKDNAEGCRKRSISVFLAEEIGLKECRKVQLLASHKRDLLCKVLLNENAGYIRQVKLPHIDWWLYKDFQVLDYCEMVTENE